MNHLPGSKKLEAVQALAPGLSVKKTSSATGIAKNTVKNLLLTLGSACFQY